VVPVVKSVGERLELVCACLTHASQSSTEEGLRRGDSHVECASLNCAVGFEHRTLRSNITTNKHFQQRRACATEVGARWWAAVTGDVKREGRAMQMQLRNSMATMAITNTRTQQRTRNMQGQEHQWCSGRTQNKKCRGARGHCREA